MGAECFLCEYDMTEVTTCDPGRTITFADGEEADPIPYGEERSHEKVPDAELPGTCHDCGVSLGSTHHPGCDMEECPRWANGDDRCDHHQYFICACETDEKAEIWDDSDPVETREKVFDQDQEQADDADLLVNLVADCIVSHEEYGFDRVARGEFAASIVGGDTILVERDRGASVSGESNEFVEYYAEIVFRASLDHMRTQLEGHPSMAAISEDNVGQSEREQ